MNASSVASPTPSAPRPLSPLWWSVIAAYFLLIARKPWALLAPQLWAEDGTVHLNDNDQWGASALFLPYRGYLHLLPRLIAWISSHVADVALWPTLYNNAALFITLLLFVRVASPRLALPGKPWLVLAFILVPHSGEVFLNITNLHWLTGFFLVLQILIARPTTATQRFGDWALIILAGLTDPSPIIFLPLFAWRWWRERNFDNAIVLLLVGTCAAIQAYFLATTGSHLGAKAAPIHLITLIAMAGCRLVIWPLFGARAVLLLPPDVQALVACVILAALIAWVMRPHKRRALRATILAAWALISFATVFRIRPDTWVNPIEDLGYGEPYFYMSRLLLVWLVIWEFDSESRAIACVARGACLLGLALSLPNFRVPAQPDYHWTENCEPVRRGVPADIPTLPEGWTLEYHGRRVSN